MTGNKADQLEIGEPIDEEAYFSWIIVGSCPHCGAPIWTRRPQKRQKEVPENKYTCECKELAQQVLRTQAASNSGTDNYDTLDGWRISTTPISYTEDPHSPSLGTIYFGNKGEANRIANASLDGVKMFSYDDRTQY